VANVARCEDVFHQLDAWSPTDWACALAGETGEACNLIKKLRRGEEVESGDIARELADVVIYADLLAARCGIDLGEAVRCKFNEVSHRRGSAVLL
jgi:NTP pyrophosphatase (non-canonical NTP hydrolase)